MRSFLSFLKSAFLSFVVMLFLIPMFALAQEVITPPSVADWNAFLTSLGGVKTLGTLGVVGVVVQGLMLLLKTKIGDMAGKYQLLSVLLLTLISGMVALKTQGADWASVLTHSTTLAALQVFLHQLYNQFITKANEATPLAPK